MKNMINKTVSNLKGVSTLDASIRKPRIIVLLLISVMALGGAVRGGHSTLDLVDPSFDPQIETAALGCKFVEQIIPLPDGKFLVSGTFNTYNRQSVGGLMRLNADATLDTTFTSNLPSGVVAQMVVLFDGKILVLKQDFRQAPIHKMLRLNADGTNDDTFNANLGSSSINSFAVDANGRIILTGQFTVNNVARNIIRLNPNGSLDSSFQSSLTSFMFLAIAAQNNKVIVSTLDSTLRLNEDGTIDPSFIANNIRARVMIVQPDGKILAYVDFGVLRLNQNGSGDAEFQGAGFSFPPNARRVMALSADGKITFAARTGNAEDYRIRRLLSDGTEDGSFSPYTAVRFNSLAVPADGGVLIGDGDGPCFNHPFQNDFVRLSPNGSPDRTFDTGIGFQNFTPSSVRGINAQPDGKVLIGGEFNLVNDVPRYKIARLNADSTVDPTFQISTSGPGDHFSQIHFISHIRTQGDGKIVATGDFAFVVNGETKSNLVRLNSDGSIDSTFVPSVAINWLGDHYLIGTNRFVTYNDGKLLIGTSRGTLIEPATPVKLLSTGELDTSFIPGAFQQDAVFIHDITIQPDGKIIIGGNYRPSSNIKSFVARLNADGSLDTTFQTYEQFDRTVRAFVLLQNGKIVVSETVLTSPAPPPFTYHSNVFRLNPDGTVDSTFEVGTGADGKINTMLLLPTGRIFVGGIFSTFNGQPRANLVQLNEDGSVFTPAYDLNDEVLSLAVDSTGRVFAGGNFTTIFAGDNGAPRSYVAALIDASPNRTRFDFDGDLRADLAIYSAEDGMWWVHNSLSDQIWAARYGLSEDKTVPADFDGDGKTDIALFRPSDGIWYLMQSTSGVGAVQWGANGDKPITGDFDGDRKDDIAVWRPSSAVWWIQNSSNGSATILKFGLPGDLPLSYADFDGDQKTDIGVWRPSDGNFYWLASGSNNQFNVVHFGANGDVPAVADYNGDGRSDLAVYRPTEGNWYQYLSSPTGEYTFSVVRFGSDGDVPVPADYDGDGKTDPAIRRGNEWHILHSALGYSVGSFGDSNAQAVAAFPMQ